MKTTLPVVQRRQSGVQHAVWADTLTPGQARAPDDSLCGFTTLCGRTIGSRIQWPELEDRDVTCGSCLRILQIPEYARYRILPPQDPEPSGTS